MEQNTPRSEKRVRIIVLLAAILMGCWLIYSRLTTPLSSQSETKSPPSKANAKEEKTYQKMLGVWQDSYQGKRTMTLNEDGSGTMLVELTGLQATLFAPKLRFDMQWTVEGKIFKQRTEGGEPAD